MSNNVITDKRAAAAMADEDERPTADTSAMLAALGDLTTFPDDAGDAAALEAEAEAEAAAAAALEDEQEPEPTFEYSAVANWTDIIANDPNPAERIADVPEALRPAVGNAAQARITDRNTAQQGGFDTGLEYGMRYATLRDQYENDREAFDELSEGERDLYHQLDKRSRDRQAAAAPAAPATPQQGATPGMVTAKNDVLASLERDHPEAHATILEEWDAEYGKDAVDGARIPLTAEAAFAKFARRAAALAAAEGPAPANTDTLGGDLGAASPATANGGASARRRQAAATKRAALPKADITDGGKGAAADVFANVKLDQEGSGRTMLEHGLAQGFSR